MVRLNLVTCNCGGTGPGSILLAGEYTFGDSLVPTAMKLSVLLDAIGMQG